MHSIDQISSFSSNLWMMILGELILFIGNVILFRIKPHALKTFGLFISFLNH